MAWFDPPLRVALTGAHKLLRATWFVRRPRTYGAHAIALTPKRKLILVKLRYAPGWRVPGGGRKDGEYLLARNRYRQETPHRAPSHDCLKTRHEI